MQKILKVFRSKSSNKTTSASTTPAPSPATQPNQSKTSDKMADKIDAPVPLAESTPVKTNTYLQAIAHRRSVYPLAGASDVSDDRIVEIVQEVLRVSPSSYNTQPMRVAIFLGEQHKKFWKIISDASLPLLQPAGEEVVAKMSGMFGMFSAAYGSISFWTDTDTIKEAGEVHKSVATMFPQFGEHAIGMLQIQVWTAIELEGLGANLQHFQCFPPAEAALRKEFNLPETWNLTAHLNIGNEQAPHPPIPDKKPFSETLKVFKA